MWIYSLHYVAGWFGISNSHFSLGHGQETISEREKEPGSLVVSRPRSIDCFHTENCWFGIFLELYKIWYTIIVKYYGFKEIYQGLRTRRN
jgi:hypothetical protein